MSPDACVLQVVFASESVSYPITGSETTHRYQCAGHVSATLSHYTVAEPFTECRRDYVV